MQFVPTALFLPSDAHREHRDVSSTSAAIEPMRQAHLARACNRTIEGARCGRFPNFQPDKRSSPLCYAPSATSAANRGFIGNGAVVSYLNDKGDNDETYYGNGTSLYVRALRQLRICPYNSARVG